MCMFIACQGHLQRVKFTQTCKHIKGMVMKSLPVWGAMLILTGMVLSFTACSTTQSMKKVIYTEQAPKPIGPYSQATEANGWVFVSGQIAIDPASGELYTGNDIKEETRRVMENLKAIITESGCTMADVMKCTIFLKDMNDFAEVNSVYGKYFPEYAPARETVAVAGLPKNVRVEISAVVLKR